MDIEDQQRGVAFAFWARVDQIRTAQGMPVTELSRRSRIRRQTYMQLRHTTRRPRRYIVIQIATAIGLDISEALRLAGLNPVDSDLVRVMIAEAVDLNDEQKASLNALLDVYDNEENTDTAPETRRLTVAQVA